MEDCGQTLAVVHFLFVSDPCAGSVAAAAQTMATRHQHAPHASGRRGPFYACTGVGSL